MQPILKIKLSAGKSKKNNISEEWERDFLGGALLAARLLYRCLTNKPNPFSPDAPSFFIIGPPIGTSDPTVGRFAVCGKGPANGLWAESNCGSLWNPGPRFAGFDGLWITGKTSKPVYLSIGDGDLEFRNATDLWG